MNGAAVSLLAAVTVVAATLCAPAQAETTVLGPTPYHSRADSPFPVDGSNPKFFLEDFEPPSNLPPSDFIVGKFSPLGAQMVWGSIVRGSSVDADDGAIDGSGHTGWSGVATTYILFGTESEVDFFTVQFDAQVLGFLPTAVGFVATAGAPGNGGFSIYDPAGNRKDFAMPDISLNDLTAADDRFIGVIDPDGISRIEIGVRIDHAPNGGLLGPMLQLDHFQYGLLVPEPPAFELGCSAACLIGLFILAQSRRTQKGLIHDPSSYKPSNLCF